MEEEDENFILPSTTTGQVVNITQDAQRPKCYMCKRNFRTNRGILQIPNTCRKKNNTISNVDTNIDNQSAAQCQEACIRKI